MLPEYLIQHAIPYALVVARMAGVFVAAPMLGGSAIPTRMKVLLTIASSAAVYPVVGRHVARTADPSLITIAPIFLSEAAIGLVMGLIASIPLMAMEMAGTLIGQQMGFGLARVYNPEVDLDSDILGRLLFYVAFGAFLAVGGPDIMFAVLAHSFVDVPTGALTTQQLPLEMLTSVLGSGVQLAIRVSAPAMGLVLLLLLAFGVLTKTMPQINVMSEGFAVKIVGGLAVLGGSLYAAEAAAGEEVSQVMALIVDWVGSLGRS